jgi:hypothetical protein
MGAVPGEWSVDRPVYLRREAGCSFVVMPRYGAREAALQELKTHLSGPNNAHVCLSLAAITRVGPVHAGAASIPPGPFQVKEFHPKYARQAHESESACVRRSVPRG